MKTNKTSEFLFILLFCLIGLIFTLPAFFSDFYTGHNVLTHLIWSRQFAEQFWGGDLYPRWLMNMNDGLGSPAFFFYFPFPFFFTSIFHAPFLQLDPDGWLQLGMACAAAFSLSGVFCYLWLRTNFGQSAAALGALVYMLLPYHLLVDLYYRFAFTEFWAFVFMPLCLLFVEKIQRGERFGFTGTAISYTLLFLTHLPTVLIFSPVLLCYVVATDQPGNRTRTFLRLSAALLLGAGLSAFYWVPAISTQANVSFSAMLSGDFHFENNFLFSLFESHPKRIELGEYHSFVTLSTLFTLGVGLISWLTVRRCPGINNRAKNFWFAIGIFAFFMMLNISTWLWQALPLLPRIQFPYRFNLLLALAVTFLAASKMQSISQYARSPLSKLWIVITAAFIASQALIAGGTLYQGASSRWNAENLKTINRELALSPDVLEYLPRWADPKLFPVTMREDVLIGLPKLEIKGGEGEVSVVHWSPAQIVLQSSATTPILLVVKHLYYPNWQARMRAQHQPLVVSPSADHGFISVEIPPGSQQVTLTMEPGLEESRGLILSILSAAVLIIISGRIFVRNTKESRS